MMAAKRTRTAPAWSDIKARLADFDRAGLLGVVQDLYALSKDNRTFLHTRFGLGDDVLEPYKEIIDRWISPNVYRNQETSVSQAKKAIADYKKAAGQPEGLAELMVFFCECAVGFCNGFGYEDEGYFDALLRMFEQALKVSVTLPAEQRDTMRDRLEDVCHRVEFGYGVGDTMETLLAKYQ
jgi:hypothetical protein